nr:hypothetical protein [Tanacetum cinerariifolium]
MSNIPNDWKDLTEKIVEYSYGENATVDQIKRSNKRDNEDYACRGLILKDESMNPIFDEKRFSSISRPSQRSLINGTKDIGGSVVSEEVTEEGFKQKSRINYFDTLALVTHISTIRLLIAMTSIYNLIIHQMDAKTAFLNGKLDEEMDVKTAFFNGKLDKEVYMNQPHGFIMPDNENKVDLTKEFLSSSFSMKDIGDADVILGIRIKHESNGLAISQSHYIKKVVSHLEYSRMIGCLMYAMTCTRPDIAFAMGKLSRYTSNPGTQHWQAIQRELGKPEVDLPGVDEIGLD